MELQGTKESDISGFDCTDNTRMDQLIVGFGLSVGFVGENNTEVP